MKQSSIAHSLLFLFIILLLSCQNDPKSDKNDQAVSQEQLNVDTNENANKPGTPGIAEDYTNTNRVIWQKPDMIIDLLGDVSNKTVADIGAGTGFFALRITPKAKKVIAIDIDERFVEYLDSVKQLELPENLQPKLEARLADPNDPHLQAEEADAVIIVNTFMYIENKVEYLKILQKGMSKGGKLVIVDFKKKRSPLGPPSEIRMPIHVVEEALYEAGYRNIETNDTALDYQYIVTAQK
ncbi:MAG: class I SAM-dependent methyltransferase [Saprospiraceae bacterium]|nr:class I SAM-dependent methyltransferase [Saprospiraceae bacterium]